MNATIFGRIFWKEYHGQRSFWISMAVLTLVVELVLLADPFQVPAEMRFAQKFGFALACAMLYALGSGATLFAAEREAGTYDFLRGLPVKPLEVFTGKLVFAVVSTAAMFLVGWTLALLLPGGLPNRAFQQWLWVYFGFGCIDVLAWVILFSLLLKRPLIAAILAGMCASYPIPLIGNALPNSLVVPGFLLVVVILAVVDTALAARWFDERFFRRVRPQIGDLSEDQIDAIYDRLLPWRVGRPRPVRGMLGRLVRQELRQSATMSMVLIGLVLITSLLLVYEWISWGDSARHGHWLSELMPIMTIAGFSACLLGSTLFLGDQVGCQFRFLTERGIPPRLVWLSRQIRGVTVLLLGLVLVLPPIVGLIATGYRFEENSAFAAVYLVGFAVVAYACGQLCSMAIRSGIVAATCGTILTMLVCSWARIMDWLGLHWLWSVAPLLLAFVVATRLRAPGWLLERNTWRSWLRPGLAIAVPALAILVAVPLVRVYEIPQVSPGFDVAELSRPMTPEEQKTLALYQRAVELQRKAANPALDESARRNAGEQAIALALEASRRPLPGFCLAAALAAPETADELHLGEMVLASGKRLESARDLNASLDRYIAAVRIAFHARLCRPTAFMSAEGLESRVYEQLTEWAANDQQKPERVLDALRTLEKLWRNPRSYCELIKFDYLYGIRFLAGDRDALNDIGRPAPVQYSDLMRWLPWERARAVRLLNRLTAEEFKNCKAIDEALAEGGSVDRRQNLDMYYFYSRKWDFTFNVISCIMADKLVGHETLFAPETSRRAARLILALEAWKLEHGKLPDSLDELKGKYLERLPVDPITGSEFRYAPKGWPNRTAVAWWAPDFRSIKTNNPRRPFVACLSQMNATPEKGLLVFPIP